MLFSSGNVFLSDILLNKFGDSHCSHVWFTGQLASLSAKCSEGVSGKRADQGL